MAVVGEENSGYLHFQQVLQGGLLPAYIGFQSRGSDGVTETPPPQGGSRYKLQIQTSGRIRG